MRQYVRDSSSPFPTPEEDPAAPPSLAVRVVIDRSTSMNQWQGGRTRIESLAEAAMLLHPTCEALGIDHQVAITPQQTVLAELGSGERGKALTAGMAPAHTGYEDIAVAIRQHSEGLESSGAQISLLFILHDGYPNDAAAANKLCLELRGKVEVIGVLLAQRPPALWAVLWPFRGLWLPVPTRALGDPVHGSVSSPGQAADTREAFGATSGGDGEPEPSRRVGSRCRGGRRAAG